MGNLIELKGRKSFGNMIDDFLFVEKAMGYGFKIYSSHICISKGMMVASDGARLHECKCPVKSARPGLYRVIKKNKGHIILYRTNIKIKGNFPKYRHLKRKKKNTELGPLAIETPRMPTLSIIIRAIPDTEWINPNYIADLGGYWTSVRVCTRVCADDSMVVFENGERTAIVMTGKL